MFRLGSDPELEVFHSVNGRKVPCYSAEQEVARKVPESIKAINNVTRANGYPWRAGTVEGFGNMGLGTDGSSFEMRYTRGLATPEDLEQDTTFWLKRFEKYNKGDFKIRSGSGRSAPLGGHLHAVWSKTILGPLYFGESYKRHPHNGGVFTTQGQLNKLISLLVPVAILVEGDSVRAAKRRGHYSYGRPFSYRTDPCHIEWRMPASFLHDKVLAHGLFGLWGWWANIVDAVSYGQIKITSVEDKIDVSRHFEFGNTLASNLPTGPTSHIEWKEKASDFIEKNIQIYNDISPKIFEIWAPYFLPMLEFVLDGNTFNEDNDILKIWTGKSRKPIIGHCCSKCKEKVHVHGTTYYRGSVLCSSCRQSLSCIGCGIISSNHVAVRSQSRTLGVCKKCLPKYTKTCPECNLIVHPTNWDNVTKTCRACRYIVSSRVNSRRY